MATKKLKINDLKKIIKEEMKKVFNEANWDMKQDSQKLADVLGNVVGSFSVREEVEVGGRVLNPQRRYAIVSEQGKLKIYDYGSALVGAKQWLGDTTEQELMQLKNSGKALMSY
jgi:type II secretory pathway component PulC